MSLYDQQPIVPHMAPREDLIESAINFLQDPSVASSPVEKRIEFLKSKNLTQDEIEISLARTSQNGSISPSQNTPYYPPTQPRGPPSARYGYPYNPYGEWQPPPPEPPKRDWRDWFIMATVVGGAGYGLYVLAQRYVKPLIAPPTPAQLEQDKTAIDEQFNKAFALIDTLTSDTTALKEAEEARTQRLDSAITDIESIVAELKTANARREDDSRRMDAEIKTIKDSLPKSIDGVREASEKQLKELSNELGSLKILIGNRMGGGSSNFASPTQNIPRTQPANISSVTGVSAAPPAEPTPGSSSNTTGVSNAGKVPSFVPPPSPYGTSPSVPTSSRSGSSTPFGSAGGKAAIPAWQMAAAGKSKEYQASTTSTMPSGVMSPPADGSEAVAALNAS